MDPLQAIRTQVMWNRLIAVVEEQAQALLRTAFGSVAREAGDLSAGVYDLQGRMLAQAVTGTPGHVNSMAAAVGHFMQRFPLATMKPGDVFITNDPWLGTGHLFDYVVVTPVFQPGARQPVALFASTCHTIDVGGVGFSAEARSVFEEGTCIPHLRLVDAGRLNEDLMAVIQANSRNPVEARGDILSLVSSNDVGAARLVEMMAEFGIASLEPLAAHILEHSRRATLAAIARLPQGRWRATMQLDGYEAPITLVAELVHERVGAGEGAGRGEGRGEGKGDHEAEAANEERGAPIVVSYAGSSAASARGINSPKCYTDAYSVFGLKCLIAPEVPNNAGSLSCFEVRAEPGSIVHPLRPAPVTARHVVGQMLPDLMFGCLEQALQGQVPGESAGSIWVLAMAGGPGAATGLTVAPVGRSSAFSPFNTMSVGLGGMGARPGKDGLATTAFPSGVGAIPVEVTETQAPVVFWHKEFLADSGGAGRYRGGLAQRIVVGGREGVGFSCAAATFDRRANPARGRSGGQAGAAGAAVVLAADGAAQVFEGKGAIQVPAGAKLQVDLPGGGGFGLPHERAHAAVAADVAAGYVTAEAAAALYGMRGAADPGAHMNGAVAAGVHPAPKGGASARADNGLPHTQPLEGAA